MTVKGIGIDEVEVKRFLPFVKEREHRFLSDNFTEEELNYCFSFSDPSEHLAGTFAAKEAAWKALGQDDLHQSVIEVQRGKNGKPEIFIGGSLRKDILISISHTAKTAAAIAILL